MKLYEINEALEALLNEVDPETGELVCDMDALEALTLARDEKLEGLALYIKNEIAEAEAIESEAEKLKARAKAAKAKAERAKSFLVQQLGGEKFQTARVAVSYRKSEQVEIGMGFFANEGNERFFKFKEPDADKAAIKAALKAGEIIPGAELVSKLNMQIK